MAGGLNLYLCSNNESRQRYKITTEDIPLLVLSLCDNWVDRATSSLQLSDIKVVVNSLYNFSVLTKSSKYLPMKTMILENLGLAMKIFKALSTIHPDSITWEEKKMYFTVLLDFIRKYGRVNETNAVLELLNRDVTKIAYDLRNNGLDDTLADLITEFFDVVRSFGFEPESKTLQNEVYEYYSGRKQSAVSEEKKKKIYDTLNFK